MTKTYSTYEAKARFSEVLRSVRQGRSVFVSYRGREVAEIRPVEPRESAAERLRLLETRGVVGQLGETAIELTPIVRRRGALFRYLSGRS